MSKQKNMEERIFRATESLMAKQGIQGLSMQKIAASAGISAGTIYLYFENKEDLLKQLAQHIFDVFHHLLQKDYDAKQPLFSQYRTMWKNLWAFLLENPDILVNLNQYQSLPHWSELYENAQACSMNVWRLFCQQGVNAGMLIDLPPRVLWNLSLNTAVQLALESVLHHFSLDENTLEKVIEQSFKAISN